MSTPSNHILDVDGFPVSEGTTPRKRASRPPFLDLTREGIGKGLPSDRREHNTAGHQAGWEGRRVVTDSQALVGDRLGKERTVSDRLQHRPLPAPPTQAANPNVDTERRRLPSSASSGMLRSGSNERQDTSSNRRSLAITSSSSTLYASSTPQTPARRPLPDRTSPTTPGTTDPRTLNRTTLIGVGELSTPRYTDARMTGHQEASARRMQDRARGVPSSTSYDTSLAFPRAGYAKRDRQVSGPRVREPKREEERRGVPRLPSLGDLGTFKIPTPPSGSPSSPAPPSQAPPHRNPPQHQTLPSTPSAQSILRQFGSTRDFSHLPPSPSSASIGKIMNSSSMGSLAFHPSSDGHGTKRPPTTGTGSPRKSRTEDRTREEPVMMDEETREVIRRLDGLGKSSSGSLKRKGDEARRKSSGGCES